MQIQGVTDIYLRKRGWWSVLTSDHQGLIWYECKGLVYLSDEWKSVKCSSNFRMYRGELQNFVAYYESDEDVGAKRYSDINTSFQLILTILYRIRPK